MLKDDIHAALEALWLGDSGASVDAVGNQPTLMGLRHVAALASERAQNPSPSEHLIARACRDRISRVCEVWNENPDIARAMLGVGDVARGLTRRERRHIVEDRYGISYDLQTHPRPNKPSYEQRVLLAIAAQMATDENDFIDGLATAASYLYEPRDLDHLDFADNPELTCESYTAKLSVGSSADGHNNMIYITRRLKLLPIQETGRHVTLRVGLTVRARHVLRRRVGCSSRQVRAKRHGRTRSRRPL